MIIQLQRMDNEGVENLGGLYIESKHIVAVYKHVYNESYHLTCVATVDGKVYLTPFSVSEILDMLQEQG